MPIQIEAIRAQFPSLHVTDGGGPRIYFDNPGGTQTPQRVIDAMAEYLGRSNANVGGSFETSRRTDAMIDGARAAMADFLNAASPDEIIFGQNMTTLTFHMSRTLGRLFRPGDEILLTRMEHEANISPWLHLARDLDLTVKWLDFDPATFEFDLAQLPELLTPRTRLAAINYASNATGTINDVETIVRAARKVGALTYIDAVQFAPHGAIDVQRLGCDFLVCSAYKFFGPHQGILWGGRETLDRLDPYKVRPAPNEGPGSFETGTLSHEGMAGVAATIDYLAWIGETMAMEYWPRYGQFAGRRKFVRAGMDCLFDYERALTDRLIGGLQKMPGLTVQGLTDPAAMARRVPTISFTVQGRDPTDIARRLGERNIFVWDGHNYAVEPIGRLGLLDKGGVVRVGLAHYNDQAEVDRLLGALIDVLAMEQAA